MILSSHVAANEALLHWFLRRRSGCQVEPMSLSVAFSIFSFFWILTVQPNTGFICIMFLLALQWKVNMFVFVHLQGIEQYTTCCLKMRIWKDLTGMIRYVIPCHPNHIFQFWNRQDWIPTTKVWRTTTRSTQRCWPWPSSQVCQRQSFLPLHATWQDNPRNGKTWQDMLN